MFTRLLFYLRYAARNLRRNARWTTFAVFCIAAGVATVVALRALGLAIGDSLIDNVRNSNHGDITLGKASGGGFFSFANMAREDSEDEAYSDAELERVEAWVAERGGQMTAYSTASNLQITAVDYTSVGRPQFVSTFFIDAQTFPPTGDILAADPAGVPLRELMRDDNSIVISRNLADTQGIAVGDTVRISNTTELFTVRGIVATETEANLRNPWASFFGFAYLNIGDAETLQISPRPNTISLTLPPIHDIESAARELNTRIAPSTRYVDTVPELVRQNAAIADLLGRFIVVMGLGALLIGGGGIINTMLVMVGRRTTEIAALKTFGLKGRQVAALFLAEAFLLGVIGSVVGSLLGTLMSVLVNRYGELFLQQRLTWRLYPEAIAYGLVLGVVVSLVFGVLPVLTANRIRPASILRPNETVIPAAGCLHSLIALLLVIIVIGGVAGRILGDVNLGQIFLPGVFIGMISVALTLIILGVLVGLLWVIVWLVSKLPSFGIVDLRLALRNLTSRRVRTATTLLALSAGMFALSSITFVGVGTREILQFQLSQGLGGNVLVFPLTSFVSQSFSQGLLDAQLERIEGIQYRTRVTTTSARITAVNDVSVGELIPFTEEVPGAVRRRVLFAPLQVRETDNPTPRTIIAGRDLTPEDRGQNVLVASQDLVGGLIALNVGDRVRFAMRELDYEFEVIGILASSGFGATGFGFSELYVPPASLSGMNTSLSLTVLQVDPAQLNQVLLDLSAMPFTLALDITFIDGLLSRFIDQFSAIPTVVGLLSLLAAAVAMANTVSLSTLERRRQIGILKAVGLKGRRVLGVMLLENTLIGLLGGLLGIGLSALGVALMTQFSTGLAIPVPREAVPVAVGLIIASVVIAWTATFLSARVAIQERVTNVLRYE